MSTHKNKFCEITNKNEKQDDNEVTQLNTSETQMNHSREDSPQKDETRKELEEAKTIECATCNEKFGSMEKLIKQVMEIECINCNKTCESVEKLMEHMNERECDKGGRWICCGTYLKGQEKDKNEMAFKITLI